jgi:transcription termination factor NusB
MLSPKVLDRAFTIEFHDVDLEDYPPEVNSEEELKNIDFSNLRERIIEDLRSNGKFLAVSKEEINKAVKELKRTEYWEILKKLNKALEPYDLHFGYRVVDEIALFFKNAKESKVVSFENDDEIFDSALLMKILPKFHGNRKKLEKPLLIVLKVAKDGKLDDNDIEKKADELFKKIFDIQQQQLDKSEIIIKELKNWKNYRFKHTAKKVLRMLRQLYEIGFASFS